MNTEYEEAFLEACARGSIDEIKRTLLWNTLDCNITINSWTPLQIAVHHFRVDVVELLLQHGADPNVTCSANLTPLMCLCLDPVEDEEKALKILDLLMQFGTNIELKDCMESTAIQNATIQNKNWFLIPHLIKHGANSNDIFSEATQRPALFKYIEHDHEQFTEEHRQLWRKYRLKGVYRN